ncbi:MAG: PEP-CTERM sorting domain-containing protein [Phycisphaerae bacterium]|nr:PEP-CTERM sorting domain-containing protein [Phycisphaerae bacterium]
MVKKVVLIALMAGLAAGVASAADVSLYATDLSGTGWNKLVLPDSTGRGSVTDRLWGTEPCMQFTNGGKDRGGKYAAISTGNYAGTKAAQITSLKIRLYGIEGTGSTWQAPMFVLALEKNPGDTNNRIAWWIPWADTTAREPGVWKEYDAMTDGQWYVPNAAGARFATFGALTTAYPNSVLATDSQVSAWGFGAGATGTAHSFNVGFASMYNEVLDYGNDARGVVDWFELGIDGAVTKFYLNEVPEPATLVFLALGSLLVIRRRR